MFTFKINRISLYYIYLVYKLVNLQIKLWTMMPADHVSTGFVATNCWLSGVSDMVNATGTEMTCPSRLC